ncbi:unnamed protein product [Boreogadus saida]
MTTVTDMVQRAYSSLQRVVCSVMIREAKPERNESERRCDVSSASLSAGVVTVERCENKEVDRIWADFRRDSATIQSIGRLVYTSIGPRLQR